MTNSNICPQLPDIHAASFEGHISSDNGAIAEGCFIHSDPALNLAGDFKSSENHFLDLSCTTQGEGQWCALHLPLNLSSSADISHLGFLCRLSAPHPWMLRACLRSEHPEHGFQDCFFPKHLLCTERQHSHVDVLHLDSQPEIPLQAQWRELVFFLPRVSFTLGFQSLHIFAA